MKTTPGLRSKLEIAINKFHTTEHSYYASICSDVDIKELAIVMPNNLALALKTLSSYVQTEAFKTKESDLSDTTPDGKKPKLFESENTLGWSIISLFLKRSPNSKNTTFYSSYDIIEKVIDAFKTDSTLPYSLIWSSLCKELQYHRIQNNKTYQELNIPKFNKKLYLKNKHYLDSIMEPRFVFLRWLYLESYNSFREKENYSALLEYEDQLKNYISAEGLEISLTMAKTFKVYHLTAVENAILAQVSEQTEYASPTF